MPAGRVCIIPYLTEIVHEWFIGDDLHQNIFTDFTSITLSTNLLLLYNYLLEQQQGAVRI